MGASIWELQYGATINTVHATVNIWEALDGSLYMGASKWEILNGSFYMGRQSTQCMQQSTYGSLYLGACI